MTLPDHACDCHVHVFGNPATTRMDPARAYTPPAAGVDALKAHMRAIGLDRCVLVQPSVYGTDNSILVEALGQLGSAARGICVVPETADPKTLADLDDAGVRGIRINLESAGRHTREAIERSLSGWVEKVSPLGWHIQLYAAFDAVASAAPLLRACGVPVVIDHFAMMPMGLSADRRRSTDILTGLLAGGNVFLKCSGFYRVPEATMAALADVVGELYEAAPSQLVWASDWPHTARKAGGLATDVSPFREIEPNDILAHLYAWLPTAQMQDAVLVRNPARLYDFGG